MKDQIMLRTWLRLTLYDSLVYAFPLLIRAPTLSRWSKLRVSVPLTVSHSVNTPPLTFFFHGNMTVLVSTKTATYLRLPPHRRVTALLRLRKQHLHHSTVGVSVDTIHNPLYALEPLSVTTVEYDTFKEYLHRTMPKTHRVQQPHPSARARDQPPQSPPPTLYECRLSWHLPQLWQYFQLLNVASHQHLRPYNDSQTQSRTLLNILNHTPTCTLPYILSTLQTEVYPPTQTKHLKHTYQHFQTFNQHIPTLIPKLHFIYTHTIFPITITKIHLQKSDNRNQNYIQINIYILYIHQIQFQLLQNTPTSKYNVYHLQHTLATNYSKKIQFTVHIKPTYPITTNSYNSYINQSVRKKTTNLTYIYIRYPHTPQTLKATLTTLLQRYTPHDLHKKRNRFPKKLQAILFLQHALRTPTNFPVHLHLTNNSYSYYHDYIHTKNYKQQSTTIYKIQIHGILTYKTKLSNSYTNHANRYNRLAPDSAYTFYASSSLSYCPILPLPNTPTPPQPITCIKISSVKLTNQHKTPKRQRTHNTYYTQLTIDPSLLQYSPSQINWKYSQPPSTQTTKKLFPTQPKPTIIVSHPKSNLKNSLEKPQHPTPLGPYANGYNLHTLLQRISNINTPQPHTQSQQHNRYTPTLPIYFTFSPPHRTVSFLLKLQTLSRLSITYSSFTASTSHFQLTYSHFQLTYLHLQPTYLHFQLTYSHFQLIHSHFHLRLSCSVLTALSKSTPMARVKSTLQLTSSKSAHADQ